MRTSFHLEFCQSNIFEIHIIKSYKLLSTILSDIYSREGPRSAVGRASDSKARGPWLDTRSGYMLPFLLPLIQERQLSITDESIARCTGQPLWRPKPAQENVVRLTDRPDMTIAVYRGHKTTTLFTQQVNSNNKSRC